MCTSDTILVRTDQNLHCYFSSIEIMWVLNPTERKLLAIPAFEAYIGANGSSHQANIDRLIARGYRIVTLSVYGDPGKPLYAAVWVKRGGPAWAAIHGVNGTQCQAKLDQMRIRWAAQSHRLGGEVWPHGRRGHRFCYIARPEQFSIQKRTHHPMCFDLRRRNQQVVCSDFGAKCSDGTLGSATTRHRCRVQVLVLRVQGAPVRTDLRLWHSPGEKSIFRSSQTTRSNPGLLKRDWRTWSTKPSSIARRAMDMYYPIRVQGGSSSGDPRYAVLFAKHDEPNLKVSMKTTTHLQHKLRNTNVWMTLQLITNAFTARLYRAICDFDRRL